MATSKQLAADKANLVKARAAARTKPRSAKQIAASLANLEKARAKRKTHGRSGGAHGGKSGLHRHGHAPLGSRRVATTLKARPTHRKPTGIYRKFQKRIAPSGYDVRGKWKNSRTHHFRKRVFERRKRNMHLKHWRKRHHRLTAR